MTTHSRRPHLRVACVTVLFLVAGFRGISTGAVGDRPVFSGQATALKASVLNLEPITLADTGYFESPEFLPRAPCPGWPTSPSRARTPTSYARAGRSAPGHTS